MVKFDMPELVKMSKIQAQIERLEALQFNNVSAGPDIIAPIESALALAYIAQELSIAAKQQPK